MLYKLIGVYWIDAAQGWVVLHLGETYFLYPTGEIVYQPVRVLHEMQPMDQ